MCVLDVSVVRALANFALSTFRSVIGTHDVQYAYNFVQ